MYTRAEINRHVMGRLGLATPRDSPLQALKDVLLLDAGSLINAYYALSLRTKAFDAAAFTKALQASPRAARLPGLKGAVQAVPRELMPYVYSVTRDEREQKAQSLLKAWGIGRDEYERMGAAILAALDDKEKTLPQLKHSLPPGMSRDVAKGRGRGRERSTSAAIVAQALWTKWELLRGGIGRDPAEDPGRYSMFERRFDNKMLKAGKEESITKLATAYVGQYGPVSAADLAWWLGIRPEDAGKLLGRLDNAEEAQVEGLEGPFYVSKGLILEQPGQQPLTFLGADDPYVKAYADRRRFIPAGYEGAALTRFGESAPAVVVDGEMRGVWGLKGDECAVEMFEGTAFDERQVVTAAIRAGWFFNGVNVDVTVSTQSITK